MKRQLFDNKWVVRLVSLVFAVFLYLFVASENNAFSFQSAANQQFASINVTETISNVPVSVGEINENTFISGLPESVQVRLTGPRNVINQVMETNLRVETEDLRDVEPGSQYIRMMVDNLPDTVDYQITPSQVYVRISQLESIVSPITVEFNEEAISPGYEVTNVELNPSEIELVGNTETISEIDRVFITVTKATPATESFTGTYHVQIVNAEDEILDVNTNISEIEVQVEVQPQQREIGLHIVPFGQNQATFQYNYYLISPTSLVITGEQSLINQIDSIGVMVNVSDLTETATLRGALDVPLGVEVHNNEEVLVEVQVTPILPSQELPDDSDIPTEPGEEEEETSIEDDELEDESDEIEDNEIIIDEETNPTNQENNE